VVAYVSLEIILKVWRGLDQPVGWLKYWPDRRETVFRTLARRRKSCLF